MDTLPVKSLRSGVWRFNQHHPGRVRARLNAPNRSKNQLIVVAIIAGIPSRNNLRKALLAMTFLDSSAFPARASFMGFIEQTYPDMTKKMSTAKYPACMK